MRHSCFIGLLAIVLFLGSCSQTKDYVPPGFELHPDFQMALAASEPLVFDPVEMHFDRYGVAYVLEMPGYPLRDEESRLVRLTDSDGDGVFDQRAVFSEGLGVASSFMPYRDGFLVASPPELLWIADRDADGVSDYREVILEGFSNENLQHNFNGLTYGLDNWIYMANGGNSGTPFFPGRPETQVPLRGGDVRLHASLDSLQRVGESSGGYKLTFDPWGHLFQTHNLEHNLHLVFEDRYLERVPGKPDHALVNISDHDRDGLSRIYPIGEQQTRVNHPEQSGYFSGSCGITYYGGGRFPGEFNHGLFVADVVLNLVHFDALRDSASAFATSRYGQGTEFLASADRAFRPVNFTVGPDGSLYVLDMHREVIEHPEWIPDEIEKDLDLKAGRDQGRIYRIWPREWNPDPSWELQSPEGLLAALAHPNQWVRTTAQRLLVTETNPLPTAQLEALLLKSENPLARLHAMWVLEGVGKLTDARLLAALTDPVAAIRENALKVAEPRLDSRDGLLQAVLVCISDQNPRVRLQALLTLQGLESGIGESRTEGLLDTIGAVLDRPDTDLWIRRAATAALMPEAGTFLGSNLEKWGGSDPWKLTLRDLAEAFGRTAREAEVAHLVAVLKEEGHTGAAGEILDAVSRGWASAGRPDPALASPERGQMARDLKSLEPGMSRRDMMATAHFREVMGLPPSETFREMLALSLQKAQDASLSAEERVGWLELGARTPLEVRLPLLGGFLDSRVPVGLQRGALQQLWDSQDPRVPELLLATWENLGPEARKHATDILLYRPAYHPDLLTAMESGRVRLGEFNLDLERRRVLLFSDDEEIKNRAESLFSDAGVVQRAQVVKAYRPALELPGDAKAGSGLYQARCASCHKIGAVGVSVGPALTEIGRKSRETLLHDILDPNAAADVAYLAHTVVDASGALHTGVVLRETDASITLQLMGGEEREFPKNSIQKFSSSGLSLMPEGLEQGLNPQDMAHLLAYLQAPKE
ncbi:PVC-type heme-binding CxxCH protein [Robiginitalea sediminis]|uniref:PVC-type heme-binding CxxCH protein n=1 Tax=Robiginitalea sediminis TaxID=1982593 RepID=UPI000B4BA5B1|nr:PVC-type heme-binding CxxCH protein [Robiginitalea sediminis]